MAAKFAYFITPGNSIGGTATMGACYPILFPFRHLKSISTWWFGVLSAMLIDSGQLGLAFSAVLSLVFLLLSLPLALS